MALLCLVSWTVLGKLDCTSQYNDPSISSSYQGSQHMVSLTRFVPPIVRVVVIQVQ